MIFKEVRWLHSNKFCPSLKKEALEWYRPFKYIPCFLQKFFTSFKQRWHRIPVIVQVVENQRSGFSIKALAAEAGCRIKRPLPLINAFSTNVNAKSLESLAQSQHVKRIWYDREVKAFLDVASPTVHADKLWPENITGKGVVVAVIDTGIYNHPDLAGRIIAFCDLVNRKIEPYDDNGHGTHVAGDIAASGEKSNFKYSAPAPEAGLVGVKVLNKMGSGSLSTVIDGIQWCVQNKDRLGIRVINMSLGSDTDQSYVDDPACQAAEEAWKSGIVVCAAAGNSGPGAGTIGSPATDPEIITVGALDDMDTLNPEDDNVAEFSSRGPTMDGVVKPDVVAPGVKIVSLRSPGSMLDKLSKGALVDEWYVSLSGTSMATPICSGVVAQMLQQDSTLTPDQVKERLMQTATASNGLDPNTQGAGVLNAEKAASVSNVNEGGT